jgi:hypothetical protein
MCLHRLRAEGSSDHKYFPATDFALDLGPGSRTPIDDLHLDPGVFLRTETLSVLAVMVHARLAVLGTVYSITLAKFDLA